MSVASRAAAFAGEEAADLLPFPGEAAARALLFDGETEGAGLESSSVPDWARVCAGFDGDFLDTWRTPLPPFESALEAESLAAD